MKYEFKTDKQRNTFYAHKYKRMLEERRGRNYEYWGQKHEEMLKIGGWNIAELKRSGIQWGRVFKKEATTSEEYAVRVVKELRDAGNFARIVCGYEKDIQRRKYFTVIFKPKPTSK